MKPVLFFRLALFLPILIALVFLPFDLNALGAMLFMSLAFGGVQYVIFAAFLFYWVGRVKDPERIRQWSYVTPLLFIPFQWAGWLIEGYIEKLSNPQLTGIWDALLPFAVYILFVGYAYVAIVNVLYLAIFGRSRRAVEP